MRRSNLAGTAATPRLLELRFRKSGCGGIFPSPPHPDPDYLSFITMRVPSLMSLA